MIEIIEETLIDSIKLLPFLFITYLIMEYIEHKTSKKSKEIIKKSGKFGPAIGSILGVFPQCGFSVSATNLYAARVISLGTLIAVYLSTSDEMLPIFISEAVPVNTMLKILGVKLIITMNKIENVVDDINGKVRSLNGIFSVIDMTTDKLALFSDKTISFITDAIKKLFIKRKEKLEENGEE